MPPEPQVVSSNQIPVSPMPQTQVPQIGYAGFWLRLLAFGLDIFIVSIIIELPISTITHLVGGSNNIFFLTGAFCIQSLLIVTYFVFLTNKNQATIGKKLLGLRVVSEAGTPLLLWQIILRETIGRFLAILTLGIGYLMVAFTSKKQGLHDKIVGSVVISNPTARKTWAFVASIIIATLYLLLFVIAIIGVLASITLASLNVARAKGTDALVKTNLSIMHAQAEIDYDLNNKSYGAIFADPVITDALKKAATAVQANPSGNASATAYAVYFPLKKPTAPNTGWCVDSTGAARESVDPGTATVCP